MEALKRIKEIERKYKSDIVGPDWDYTMFILKAFEVMRKIALERDWKHGASIEVPEDMTLKQAWKETREYIVNDLNKEFEKRMLDNLKEEK